MTKLHILLLASLASLAACIDIADPDQIKKQPTDQLCEDYYFTRHPSPGTSTDWPTRQADIKKELDKRQAVAPGEWTLIDQSKIQPGMGECALKAAWGFPMRTTHSVSSNGEATRYSYAGTRYVDMSNGKVAGFGY